MFIFRIIGKIIGIGIGLFLFYIVVSIFLGIGAGILDMPSETGGNTIREELAISKVKVKAAYNGEEIENPFMAIYAGTYQVSGEVNYDTETYTLSEDGKAVLKWIGDGKIKFQGAGYWDCTENSITINIYDNDAIMAETYRLGDIWEENIRDRQMTRK